MERILEVVCLTSSAAVTVSLKTTTTSPEGAKQEGSGTCPAQGDEPLPCGDADVVCARLTARSSACFGTQGSLKAWDQERAV